MNLLWLGLAVLFEIAWGVALKASAGFSRPLASLITIVAYALSLVFLALVTRRTEIGIAYAMWAGLGIAGIAAVGVVWFKEPLGPLKAASLALVIIGVVGLHLADRPAAV